MGDVLTNVLRPMEALYGKFDTDDADMVIDSYITALSEFSDETLRAAYTDVVKNYRPSRRQPCPAPAFFVDAARKLLASTGKTVSDEVRETWRQPQVDDLKAAEAYMVESSSSLVNMALREGWGKSLRDVARDVIRQFREKHYRRPTQRELLGFRLPSDDVEFYRKNGLDFSSVDLDRVISERAKLGNWKDTDAAAAR